MTDTMNQMLGTRGYGATQRTRSLREQEADVIRRVNYALKAAVNADAIDRARAVADNRRLWLAIESAILHPANQLPDALKASIVRLGRSVQREMDQEAPDVAFLININDQMIAGLSGDPG
jgi:flagellar biosynthesis regulator FlaF